MFNKNKDLLPIGAIVLLKNASKRLMITGYLPITDDNQFYDYLGCVYPEGYISSTTNALFNKEDIESIYSVGHVDEETLAFMKTIIDESENIMSNPNYSKASINLKDDMEE